MDRATGNTLGPEGLCLRSFSPPLSSAGWSRFTLLRICVFKIFRKCGFQDGLVCLIGFCGVYSQAAVGRAIKNGVVGGNIRRRPAAERWET